MIILKIEWGKFGGKIRCFTKNLDQVCFNL